MTLSTKFPASGRATEPSRILRLGVSEYHSLAALAPAVAAHVGGVARGYLTDLQHWAAATPDAEALRPRAPVPRAAFLAHPWRQLPTPADVTRPR